MCEEQVHDQVKSVFYVMENEIQETSDKRF